MSFTLVDCKARHNTQWCVVLGTHVSCPSCPFSCGTHDTYMPSLFMASAESAWLPTGWWKGLVSPVLLFAVQVSFQPLVSCS